MEVPKARGLGRSGPRRRTGCLTCRARKVRCDETKPRCSNCDRLRLRCVYRPPLAGARPGSSPMSRSHNGTASPTNMNPIIGSSEATPATAFRSPDINFFTTVLRTDDHSIPRSATVHSLPTDQASYNSEIDMLRITGEMTSDLGRKSTDFSTGIATFTASRASQSLPAALIPGLGRAQVSGDQRLSLSPNAPSSTTDRASVGNASDVATTRGSWSDTSGTSYEDQLLQHFQTVDPPVALFAPMNTEWIYARQALVANARDSSPLLNALYCYADAHKATVEGQRWRWAPTYHKVATSEIQACLHDEMGDSSLINVFGAVLLLMISELVSGPELCTDRSYLHTGYLILQRFHDHTRHWTGLGHLLVSWVSLLDVKSLIAGREGDPLIELGNIPDHGLALKPVNAQSTQSFHTIPSTDDYKASPIEDPLRNPSYLIYEAIVDPAFRFFVQAQQVVRRIVQIDLHHRSRGTLNDEFEVLQIAHKVGADLERLWHRRPSILNIYQQPDVLGETLCASMILKICRTFRQYIANFLASFIYLHRVAFAIYPRTDRVNGAVDQIIQLATIESAEPGHLPVGFLWPLFITGLEASEGQRQWIVHEMQRMAVSQKADSPPSLSRHPTVDRVIVLLKEMARRQSASRTWADSKCVRQELFSDFFVVI